MDPATVTTILSVATKLIEFGNRAVDAVNNGDIDGARRYLEQGRSFYASERADFDEAAREFLDSLAGPAGPPPGASG